MIVLVSYRLTEEGRRKAALAGLPAHRDRLDEVELTTAEAQALGDSLEVDPDGSARVRLTRPGRQSHGVVGDCGLLELDAVVQSAEGLSDALAIVRGATRILEAEVAEEQARREEATREREALEAERLAALAARVTARDFEGLRVLADSYAPQANAERASGDATYTVSDGHRHVTAGADDVNAVAAEWERRREQLTAAYEERQAAEAAAKAEREATIERLRGLTDGPEVVVEVEFEYGNPRRYSRPWIGRIADWSNGRPELEWGSYESGSLTLTVPAGELVMWGQRDHRGERNSQRLYGIAAEDGSTVELTRAEAMRYWRNRAVS